MRNNGLDFLKFICCFMVICLHCPFPGVLGDIITPLSRIAVPVFFMITGYFTHHEKQASKKQIAKIAKLFVGANLLYLVYSACLCFVTGDSFASKFAPSKIMQFVFLNESPFGGHLWYLGAILYVLLLLYFFEKLCNREKLYFLIPVLLLTDLVFGKYSLLLINREIPHVFVRNFLFVGLPYFLIGDILQKKAIKLKQITLWSGVFLFSGTTLLERFLLEHFGLNATRDHYISTTFLAVAAFLLACNYGNKLGGRLCDALCMTGSKLSLDIYIIHPIIILVLSYAARILNNPKVLLIYGYIAPFAVFLLSIAFSYCKLLIAKKARTSKNAKCDIKQ